jgi:outer membrane biosynthesis protein TonB
LRNKSGIVWFTTEQLEKMAIKRIEPVMPLTAAGYHYDGAVSFRILVDRKGEISCIWAGAGNSLFVPAANEALQYWKFKPMLVNGKPVEFVGIMKFHVYAN